MPFKRYVEIGRVALVNYGEDFGKLVVISDVIDQNRALVDFPGESRRVENFKRMTLTDMVVDIPRCAKKSVLVAKVTEADIVAKFAASSWGKKLAKRQTSAASTDFDRYKAVALKMKKSRAVRAVFNTMKKAAK
eukprot:gene17610-23943_t